MTGTAFQRFLPIEIVAVFLCLVAVLLGFYNLRLYEGLPTEGATHQIARTLVFADLFGNNILSSLQSVFDVGGGTASYHKALGGTLGVWFTLHEQDGGQWLKSLFTSHLCTSATFGFIGQIDVFQYGAVPTAVDALLQVGRHLLLFSNCLDDGLLALSNLLQL